MKKGRWGGLFFLIPGIYGLMFSLNLPMGRMSEPGAGIFPIGLSILLCFLGIWLFVKEKGAGRIDWRGARKRVMTPLKILLVTLGFILLLERVGFFLSTLLYLMVLFLWVGRYKAWAGAGLALILGLGSWYFFWKILGIQLPRGFTGL